MFDWFIPWVLKLHHTINGGADGCGWFGRERT